MGISARHSANGGDREQARALLRDRLRQKSPANAPPSPPRLQGPAPLSFAQERLWFLDRLTPGLAAYTIARAFRLTGPLATAAFVRSLRTLADRHTILRTRFEARDEGPVQVLSPAAAPTCATVDLRALAPEDAAPLCDALRRAEPARPFDLAAGPLLRLTLVAWAHERTDLLLSMHHIASDARSIAILTSELAAGYAAALAGRALDLPPLPLQVADAATRQRAGLTAERVQGEVAFWKEALAGYPPALELPLDRPRPAIQSYAGGAVAFRLSPPLWQGLTQLGRDGEATPFLALLTAFSFLLGRQTGQSRVIVGTPVSGRGRSELEDLIGFFVNTLPIPCALAGEPGFRALLARLRPAALAALAHQELPFERLVEELNPERSLSLPPVVQVLLALQAEGAPWALAGLEVEALPLARREAQLDLTFFATENGDGLDGSLRYATALFDASTIERLARRFTVLVRGIVAEPDRPLGELPLWEPAEQHQVIAEWNAERGRDRGAGLLHAGAAATARKVPEAVALVDGESFLTYAALAARTAELAGRLAAAGAGPDVPVAVLLERRAELVVAILAILEAGSVYVPLDPVYPAERIAATLADAAPRAAVSTRALAHLVPGVAVVEPAAAGGEPTRLRPALQPDHLAYLLYTSGSTGRPKGVAVTHRAGAAVVAWAQATYTPAELARVLFATSVCFDISVFELFVPLAAGGTVVVAEHALAIAEIPAGPVITLLNTVPSAAAELVRAGELPASLLTINLAGEALPEVLAEAILARPGVALYNLYGPSEDTVYSTWARLARGGGPPPIGRPLAGGEAFVCDLAGRPLPLGLAGELRLGGVGLARGYLGRPALTAERFVPHAFSAAPGLRLYRTGDRVRQRTDGRLDFLGRIDHQVKVRGFRIELAEVEGELLALPAVAEAVVVARAEVEGGPADRLVAYFAVPAGAAVPAAAELRQALARHLPAYMIPAAFVALPALPRTPNGKVDRKALPSSPAAMAAGERGRVPPRTSTEVTVAEIWAEVLRPSGGAAGLGVFDNFFEAGGHSLLATRILGRLRQRLGVELPLRAIFERPTIAALAELAAGTEARGTTAGPRRAQGATAPLSFAQERLWFLDRLTPGLAAYTLSCTFQLAGPLAPRALRESLLEVATRHQILRTRFVTEDGLPVQEVADAARPSFACVDLAALGAAARVALAPALRQREPLAPFNLERGPLLRLTLLRLAEGEHELLLSIHHIAADFRSMEILLAELGEGYGAHLGAGRESRPPLPEQVAEAAARQRAELGGEELAQQLEHWRRALAGCPAALALPTDHPRPAVQSFAGDDVRLTLPPELWQGLCRLAQSQGATPFMALLAAFAALLDRHAGQGVVVVATPVSGRDRPELEGLIGFFVNTLPIPCSLEGEPSTLELLRRVREATLDLLSHQEVPFERLVEALNPERSLSLPPIAQVLLALQGEPAPLSLAGLAVERLPVPNGEAQLDLSLFAQERGGGLLCSLRYATALFERTTIAALGADLAALILGMVTSPELAVAALPLPSARETSKAPRSAASPAAPIVHRPHVAPGTAAERLVAELWTEVLRPGGELAAWGIHDNFFESGGHSLLAARVLSRLRRRSGVDLPLRTIFEQPTIAGLAALVAPSLAAAEIALPKTERGRPLPLSFAQERLWFLDRFEPGSTAFNLPIRLRLSGTLEAQALGRALTTIVARHEVLRTVYRDEEGLPVQVIREAVPLRLPVIELAALTGADQDRAAVALYERQARQPIDLARGPIFVAHLLRLSATEHHFLLTTHHIATDGWSLRLLARELGLLLRAGQRGGPAALPELPIQVADVAAWERRELSEGALATDLAYWREQLAGAPALLELPSDRPRGGSQTYRGAWAAAELTPELSAGLRALAQREEVTLFMVFLAAFDVLLARLSGERDVVVGTPVAGRHRPELEDLIGCFLNTLVLRVSLAGRPSFRQLLGRVREVALAAFNHQQLPFERLLAELQPERDLSRTPLFQVMLNVVNVPRFEIEAGDVRLEFLPSPTAESKFDLTLYVSESATQIGLNLAYHADLFSAARMRALLEELEALLAAVVADPDAAITAPSLITPGTRGALPDPHLPLSAAWQGAVHQLAHAEARRRPDAVAVVAPGLALSYGALDRASSWLGEELRRAGLEVAAPVAIFAHRSSPLALALLGTLKAGGAFVMLDPSYPAVRLAELAKLARPRALVALAAAGPLPAELEAALAELGLAARIELGEDPPAAALAAPAAPGAEVHPDQLAYLAFTSGSTGQPKGILGRHGSLTHFLPWQRDFFQLGPGDRVSVLSGLAHDPLHRDLMTPLLLGASMVFPDPEHLAEPGWLGAWAAREAITVAHLTPALCRLLTQPAADGRLPEAPALRYAFVVGESLARRQADDVRLLAPGAICVNSYGATETQRAVAYHLVEPAAGGTGDERRAEVLPLGRGLADVQLLVLYADGELAGVGELGELTFRSPHLALGYLNDPRQTAERFTPAPGGERLYHTGDLGRFLPNGEVAFAGRADQQVKIRGFRVEPGEIEAALARHPAVAEAVVVARQGSDGLELVAYVGAPPDTEVAELRAHLRQRLPEYMVPARLVVLPALPRTPNRKVDRRALPAPEAQGEAAAPVPPSTELERLLARIWAELLRPPEGAAALSVRTSFFDVGGHSLLATQLAARIRSELGATLPLRTIFERPTIAGLAEVLAKTGIRFDAAIPRAPRDRPLPLSFAQERLWFLDRFEPGTTAFNLPMRIRIAGVLRPRALAAALAAVVRRHEVLRTVYREEGGRPVQLIQPARAVPLPVLDLGGLVATAAAAERAANHKAAEPFDLTNGPILTALLVRLAPAEHHLLLAVHHIAIDGWSTGILLAELGQALAAAEKGEAPALPELPLQVADVAAWERNEVGEHALATDLAYWRRQLAGHSGVLELPSDHPRGAVQTFRGEVLVRELPLPLAGAVRRLARGEGATLFMLLLAAFDLVLHRQTGESDLAVGTPVAGRGRPELEGLVGCFLNTLVLRLSTAGRPSFRTLLARARETALDALAHSRLPFERLLEELRPERDLARTPLFQVFLNVVNVPHQEVHAGSLELGLLPSPAAESKFDLTLYVHEAGERIRFKLVSNADLFDAARMRDFLAQLEAVLEQAVDDPDRSIETFDLVTPLARTALPALERPLPAEFRGAVHQLFHVMAERHPDRIAMEDAHGATTYAHLDRATSWLAGELRAAGLLPAEVVLIFAHRSPALTWALLGVLKAGGAFVLLDPSSPPARLASLAELAAPRAFLTLDAAGAPPAELDAVLAHAELRLRLELPATARTFAARAAAGAEVEADQLAYIAFTSGSTGQPKGVLGRHGSLTHFLPWQRAFFGLGEEDRFSVLSGLVHDPLHRDLLTPLQLGARMVFPDPERLTEPGWLPAWAERTRITVAHLTPAMCRLLTLQGGAAVPPSAGALRHAFVVGESLARAQAEEVRRLAPEAICINSYGATETQRAVSYHLPEAAHGAPGREVLPLGKGLYGLDLLVLNRGGRLAGIGELGEIAFRSPHLALGYLRDPRQTAARFTPFAGGERLYRTGDLGRYLPNGEVAFAGRTDFQVKIRGFRVELGEIEATLARFPGVAESVVVARPDRAGLSLELTAYLAGPGELSLDQLRRFLRTRLPEHMVPARFMVLPALPRNANRKVDRQALPEPAAESAESAAGTPRTPTEEVLAELWGELLGRRQIGADDSFFDLGGHSLLATRVIAQLRAVLGVEVPLRALFEQPTLGGFAAAVDRALTRAEGDPELPLLRVERGGPLPLSFSQERQWLLDQLEPGSPAYNLAGTFRLAGELSPRALARALAALVARHEALRCRFAVEAGRPVQTVEPAGRFALPLVALGELRAGDAEREMQRLARREATRSFHLGSPPFLRAVLVRRGAREHLLFATLHHIAADGWSFSVLSAELSALYRAAVEGRAAELPPLAIQYPDFAAWQRQRLRGPFLERLLRFWRGALDGAPATLELPTDRPRPPVQSFAGVAATRLLPPATVGDLRTLGRSAGATLYMTLLALFEILLSRLSGQADLTVGTFVANRGRAEVEGLIGFFVNNLALRTRLGGAASVAEVLTRVRETTLAAYAHQDLPFERLLSELQPERDPARTPIFQVMAVLQNVPRSRFELPGLEITSLGGAKHRSNFDLTLWMFETPDGLLLKVEAAQALFDATTAARLAQALATLAAGATAAPEARPEELPLLAAAERFQLSTEWSGTGASPRPATTLTRQFQATVAALPEAVALVFADAALSYRALAAQTRDLAERLAALGVGPEVPVGLWHERGLEMVVGLLGILEAGGAYLPLDPATPAERAAFQLADAAAPALVASPALARRLPASAPPFSALPVLAVNEPGGRATPAEAKPENLAYVLYTSGSTGRPKGVLVEHRSAAAYAETAAAAYAVSPGDRLLQFASLAFDASAEEIFPAFARGAVLVLRADDWLSSPASFLDQTARQGIHLLNLPTAYWHQLVGAREAAWPAAINRVVIGGERALPERIASWQRHHAARVRLFNTYGPTEATIVATSHRVTPASPAEAPIGRPVAGAAAWVVDRALRAQPIGVPGELVLGGVGLARGYLGRAALSAERFLPCPFPAAPGARLYRTGDLVRLGPTGELFFLGRTDHQVKIRGFRVELGEIEALLAAHPAVGEAAVALWPDREGEPRLAAYVVLTARATAGELRAHLRQRLPAHMVPSSFTELPALPKTAGRKLDRRALPAPAGERSGLEGELASPAGALEAKIAAAWAEVLGLAEVGRRDNFFDLGGHSLLLVRLQAALSEALGRELTFLDVFRHPTVEGLAAHLAGAAPSAAPALPAPAPEPPRERAIAIIGMAGRFPGAENLDALWQLLTRGGEGIRRISREELLAAGIDAELVDDPAYVPARAGLEGPDLFDAAFFGYTPREAEIMDPQQRHFLEHAWAAFEDAGYDPRRTGARVGVFAGAGMPRYLFNLWSNPAAARAVGFFETSIGNKTDTLPMRVSYELDFTGPSVAVQTHCSTSLVAVHMACESLLSGACDMALAGGVSISGALTGGYLYEPGGISSPEGRTRAFDRSAAGTVMGQGVGAVVLKPLARALADGDTVRAVILGTAINNDGGDKIGFTAPSIKGQAEAIRAAHRAAGVEASSIGYVEAHGTGTALGDPIEVEALNLAFGAAGGRGSCALGSIKTNIGHADAAAGVAGLIKAVLTLEHGEIPASLHFEAPNPKIPFAEGPFYVHREHAAWPRPAGGRRRAGVSSFGIGGTNAHAVLEEAPPPAAPAPARPEALLVVSAKTPTALAAASARLARHLAAHPELALADVASTLQRGRSAFPCRRAVVARTHGEAVTELEHALPWAKLRPAPETPPEVAFLFPGQGSQHPGMARELYQSEPTVAASLDQAAEILRPELGLDLRELLGLAAGSRAASAAELTQTRLAQPALFAVSWSLAQWWLGLGVKPAALLGHSLGEFVAAALAGVFSLPDALRLVALRGRLMGDLPAGGMLATSLAEEELLPWLGPELALAAVNAPGTTVASGPLPALAELARELTARGIDHRPLHTSHAFHSPMMEPILSTFEAAVARVELSPPRLPLLSNATGTWFSAAEATNPAAWARQLCTTVRFSAGLGALLARPGLALLEVGPGRTLTTLVHQQGGAAAGRLAIASCPHAKGEAAGGGERVALLGAAGRLWSAGLALDWRALEGSAERRRVPLPTYPFERRSYWIHARPSGPPPRPPAPAIAAAPEAEPAAIAATNGALRDELERSLAAIWGELLGQTPISRDDSFFELGGSSLLAVRFGTRLRQTLGVELAPHALFEAETIAALAELVRQLESTNNDLVPVGEP